MYSHEYAKNLNSPRYDYQMELKIMEKNKETKNEMKQNKKPTNKSLLYFKDKKTKYCIPNLMIITWNSEYLKKCQIQL